MSADAHGAVLLVEDNPNDVLLTQRAFRKSRPLTRVAVVNDGDAAVEYLSGAGAYADRAAHPVPVLILLDLKLPRRSGLEVLEWRRAQPGIKRIPVVVLTSSYESADVALAYDLGANSYLVKPVAFAALLELVERLNTYRLVANQPPDPEVS